MSVCQCDITSHHTGAAEDGWTAPCPMSRAQSPPPATKQLFAVLAHSCTAPQCPTHHTKLLMTFHPPKQPVTACNHCLPAVYTIHCMDCGLYTLCGPWPLHKHCGFQLLHLCLCTPWPGQLGTGLQTCAAARPRQTSAGKT